MRHIAIVGGGYSGTLLAINLMALSDTRVTLIERDRLARGVAYSTPSGEHLLNVRAAGMSAYPDRPSHFADWLASQGLGGPETFAERRVYGRYLEAELAGARAAQGDRLTILIGEAVDVVRDGACERVLLANGAALQADAVVLAIGNLPPDVPAIIGKADLPDGVYVADPWAGLTAKDLGDEDNVLLIGTGLTAIDAALLLDAGGFKGKTLALSRRGLLPRAHEAPAPPPQVEDLPSRSTQLLRVVREMAAEHGWRGAVDSLRPHTQRLWAEAGTEERRRFLRHLRPWWDVHRHRIAPQIAARIERMQASGRLDVAAGKIVAVEAMADQARVTWRPRGSDAVQTLLARRIVNCTGPQSHIGHAEDPLIRALIASGRIRPDACRIGIDVDEAGHAIDANDTTHPTLHAIGPMTKGAWWEIVAVPDLRVQVRTLAERIAKP